MKKTLITCSLVNTPQLTHSKGQQYNYEESTNGPQLAVQGRNPLWHLSDLLLLNKVVCINYEESSFKTQLYYSDSLKVFFPLAFFPPNDFLWRMISQRGSYIVSNTGDWNRGRFQLSKGPGWFDTLRVVSFGSVIPTEHEVFCPSRIDERLWLRSGVGGDTWTTVSGWISFASWYFDGCISFCHTQLKQFVPSRTSFAF